MTKTYTTNTNNETHEIWEDNAGSIYWFVLRDGNAIRYAKSRESCKDECRQLCDMAGMVDEWDNAEGETCDGVLDRAAEKLHVRIW